MEPLARELERLIATFTEGVTSAVRSTALALVDDVLSNTGTRSARAKKAVARRPRSVRLLRRGAADIDAVKGRLLAAIGSRPGLRFEQLRAGLSIDRRELVLPLRKLVAEGAVEAKGVKRATRYFPGREMTTRSRTKRRKRKTTRSTRR